MAQGFTTDMLAGPVHDGLTTARLNYVEIEFSSAASLVVFLALFFANFVLSWIAVIFVMDGTLKDAQGRQHQLDIERSGRRAMNETAARLRR